MDLENDIENNNCIDCYFEIKDIITRLSAKYTEKYNLVPEFKAGLHLGELITGEVGVVKKEIVFSGDVLNTTSRIQAECNKQNCSLLISEDLVKVLHTDSKYDLEDLGKIKLRGKVGMIRLFSVTARTQIL